jgi:hypothetical protein
MLTEMHRLLFNLLDRLDLGVVMTSKNISSRATLSLFDMFPNASKEQLEALSKGLPLPSNSALVPTEVTAVVPQPSVVTATPVKNSYGYGVSCLLPIADRRRRTMARACVNRFLQQRYPDREMIIINATGNSLLDSTHPLLIEVMAPPNLSVGAMRNLGIERATKPWIAQWDDDDYRDPHLLSYQMGFAEEGKALMLATQVALQVKTDKDVTIFSPSAHMRTTYSGHPSTLIFPNGNRRYPDGDLEDEGFYRMYWANDVVVVPNNTFPYNMYMVAVHHGLNKINAPVFMQGKHDTGTISLNDPAATDRLKEILVSFGYKMEGANTNSSYLTPSPSLVSFTS